MASEQRAHSPAPQFEAPGDTECPSEPDAARDSTDSDSPGAAGAIAEGFTGPQTAELVGISYRQLDHWTTKGLIRSSLADATGSGSRRRYSYSDLVELKFAKKMRDQGVDLKSIARAFDYLRDQLGGEVASANIVISGGDVLLVDEDQVLSLLRQGQTAMLTVLPVAGLRRELDADVVKLFPDEPIATQLSLDLE